MRYLVLFFLGVQFLFSQISVKSFRELTMDTDARFNQKEDGNDEKCALIKIVTPYKEFDFDVGHAWVCGKDETQKGEIWLWVNEDSKYLTIRHKSLGILRRWRIPKKIEPLVTYELVLQTAKITQIVEEALPGFVILKTKPTGATILIDGQEMADTTPLQKSLKYGKHTFTIRKKLHETITGNFTIQQGKTLKIEKTLLPTYGTLQITTTENATINIDGTPYGKGQLTKVLAPGTYYLVIEKTGHYPLKKTITIKKRENNQINAPLKIQKGILQLTATPIETDIFIEGKKIGSTPFIKRIAVGNYEITLRKNGYQKTTTTLHIQHQKTTRKHLILKKGSGTWEKTYGGSGYDEANSIIETADGHLVVAGYTKSKGAGSADFWILKLDNTGNKIWEKTYGGSEDDVANSIIETSDGNLVVAGDSRILKLDNTGNKIWEKTYGGSISGYAYSIIETADGNLVVAGYTESKGAGLNDFWMLKLNKDNGNILWERTYGGIDYDRANSIIETADGHVVVAGATQSKGADSYDYDIWVLKLNKRNGNILWEKTYGGSRHDLANAIIETSDGNVVVAGYTKGKGAGAYDFWVLKIDKNNGNIIWEKTYGGSNWDRAYSIIETADGDLVVAGATESKGAGSVDFWVLKLNKKNGNVMWERTYGGSDWDRAYSIIETADGHLVVAGATKSKGAGGKDIWVLKLDSEGNLKKEE